MRIFTKTILFLSSLLLLTDCREKVLEDYYGRPTDLASPIYQQLQARGNFKNLIACIDKANYKRILANTGYFTMFAPNDAAFEEFFADNGYADVNALDSATAAGIVRYSLVYNAFKTDHLSDYQATTGWVTGQAFKRRTAFYNGVYDATVTGTIMSTTGTPTTVTNQDLKVISSNVNGGYFVGDPNSKYIPYFMDPYFGNKGLSSYDYNYFYPDTEYQGFNVADASVVNSNIIAENGVIHEIDKVILPLDNLEKYITDRPQYSLFQSLMEKYAVSYVTNPIVGTNYKILTGSTDPVYIKIYSGLTVSPNCENYLKQTDNDAQSDGWSMFVPTNDVLSNYINAVLLEHYTSIDALPPSIILDFINVHMWQHAVWPSKFKTTANFVAEPARFDPAADIVEKKILSNGFFYGTNKVQKSDLFHSVFGELYLDPKYSLVTRYLQSSGLRAQLTNPLATYALFMLSNDMIASAGITFDTNTSQWLLNGSTSQAVETLDRLVNLHIALTNGGEFNNPAGQGVLQTLNGEYVGFKNNTVFSAGNFDPAPPGPVNPIGKITSSKVMSNGTVYYLDNKIPLPTRPIGLSIKDGAANSSSPYYLFYLYLFWSGLYTNNPGNASTTLAPDGTIAGVTSGSLSTVFIPTNAMMTAAFTAGKLPVAPVNTTTAPSWNTSTDKTLQNKVANFLLYHMVGGVIVAPDGKEGGGIGTLNVVGGDPVKITVTNSGGSIKLTDVTGKVSNVILPSANSNVVANRSLIHQIDNYLNNGQ